MAQGPAPLDEADPCLEARPVCDLGGLFSFQPVLPASTQQPQADTAGYIRLQVLGNESTPVVRIKEGLLREPALKHKHLAMPPCVCFNLPAAF